MHLTEPVQIALISEAGAIVVATIAAIAAIAAATIQARKHRREQEEARQDREIARETVQALERMHGLSGSCTPHYDNGDTETSDWTGIGGVPT